MRLAVPLHREIRSIRSLALSPSPLGLFKSPQPFPAALFRCSPPLLSWPAERTRRDTHPDETNLTALRVAPGRSGMLRDVARCWNSEMRHCHRQRCGRALQGIREAFSEKMARKRGLYQVFSCAALPVVCPRVLATGRGVGLTSVQRRYKRRGNDPHGVIICAKG